MGPLLWWVEAYIAFVGTLAVLAGASMLLPNWFWAGGKSLPLKYTIPGILAGNLLIGLCSTLLNSK